MEGIELSEPPASASAGRYPTDRRSGRPLGSVTVPQHCPQRRPMITAQAPPFHRSGKPARGYTPPLNLFGFASPPRSLRPIEGAGAPQAVISPTRQCRDGIQTSPSPGRSLCCAAGGHYAILIRCEGRPGRRRHTRGAVLDMRLVRTAGELRSQPGAAVRSHLSVTRAPLPSCPIPLVGVGHESSGDHENRTRRTTAQAGGGAEVQQPGMQRTTIGAKRLRDRIQMYPLGAQDLTH